MTGAASKPQLSTRTVQPSKVASPRSPAPHQASSVGQIPFDPTVQPDCRFDFLIFAPINDKARLAFSDLAQNKRTLHEHHSRYLVVTGKEALNNIESYATRSGGETPEHPSSESSEGQIVNVGYFGVGFDYPSILGHAKYTIGRGSRQKFGPKGNVDLLLADPNDKKVIKGIAACHAILSMHPASGAWMLQAGLEPDRQYG